MIKFKNFFIKTFQIINSEWILFLSLVFITIKLSLAYGAPPTTADDNYIMSTVYTNGWKGVFDVSAAAGFLPSRLTGFASAFINALSFLLQSHEWLFICRLLPILVNIVLFYFFLKNWFGKNVASTSSLFISSLLFLGFDHNPTLAYPMMYHWAFSFYFISLILFKNHCFKQKLLWIGLLNIVSCQFFEAFYPLALANACVFFLYSKDRSFKNALYLFLPIIISFLSYICFRLFHPRINHYEGTMISIHIYDIFYTLFAYSLGGLIQKYNSILDALSFSHLNLFLILMIIFSVKKLRHTNNSSRYFGVPLVISLVLILSPNLLIALTPKYQEWARHGNSYYVTTYFSQFGWALLFAVVSNAIQNHKFRIVLLILWLLPLGMLSNHNSVKTSHSLNTVITLTKQLEHRIQLLPPNTKCVISDSWKYTEGWSCCHPYPLMEDYWTKIMQAKTGKDIAVHSPEYKNDHPEIDCIELNE